MKKFKELFNNMIFEEEGIFSVSFLEWKHVGSVVRAGVLK
jgi:hypothetical protein